MNNFRYFVVCAIWLNMVAFFQTRSSVRSFQWTAMAISKLLASYFYGYVAGVFLGGLVSFYYGPKHTISVCLVLSGILVAICPAIERYGLVPFSIVRAILGFLSAPLFPSKNLLVGAWSPTSERSTINSVIHGGTLVGITFAHVFGGLICSSPFFVNGWKEFLYVSGAINIFVAVIWSTVVADSPQSHPWVSVEERNFLQTSTLIKSDSPTKSLKDIPFRKLLTSRQVWLQTFALFGHLSIFFTFLVSLPVFLHEVCHVPGNKAAYYSIIPFCGNFVVLVTYPIWVDYLRTKKGYNVSKLRRFSSGLAFFGSCLFLLPLGYVSTYQPLNAIILVTAAMSFVGCNYSGFVTAVVEMAPQYSGIIVAINNTFASTIGFIIPLINAQLKDDYGLVVGWRYTFFIVAGLGVIFGLPFVLFGSCELQDWARSKSLKFDLTQDR